MKTDALFYKLFRISPRSLFRLVGMRQRGRYAFESITVKTTEKRFDGFLRCTHGDGPNIFLEIQGYEDDTIWWRAFREICMWYEDSGSKRPFVLIVLFLNEEYDPDNRMLSPRPPCRLIRRNLADCLKKIRERAGILSVLKPLMLSDRRKDREQLPELVPRWEADIRSLGLPEHETEELAELLLYAVVQRFRKLTLEEVREMIELTPLDKTVAGRQLIQMGVDIGVEKGRRKGREEGELIGNIRMAQRFLRHRVTPKKTLVRKGTEELRVMLEKLESELSL